MDVLGRLHERCARPSTLPLHRQDFSTVWGRLNSNNRYRRSAANVASQQLSPETNVVHVNSSVRAVQVSVNGETQEDREALRRQRISSANKGNVPWNKGRKHSPETIAKIKARTAEAMQRPEVVAKVQAAAASNVGKAHTSETKAKIGAASKSRHIKAKEKLQELSPEELETVKKKRCKTAKAMWDDPEYRAKTLAGIRKAAEERKAKRLAELQAAGVEQPRKLTHEERREKLRAAGRKAWQNPEFRDRMKKQVAELLHKRHQEMTEEARAAWRAGQRERARQLWNDPEYRAKTLAAIQARSEQLRGIAADRPPRTSKPTTAPKPRAPTKREQAAGVDRLRALWQNRLALLAKTIRTMNLLEERVTDLTQLERALANDPQRHAEAVQGIVQATQCLQLASQKVKELSAAVPPFVKYDKLGNMLSFDGEAALRHHAGLQAAAQQGQQQQPHSDGDHSLAGSIATSASLSPSSILPISSTLPHQPIGSIADSPSTRSPHVTGHPSNNTSDDATAMQQPSGSTNPSQTGNINGATLSQSRQSSLPWNATPGGPLKNGTHPSMPHNGLTDGAPQNGVDNGMLKNGMHKNGVTQNGATQNEIAQNGAAQHGAAQNGHPGTFRNGVNGSGAAQHGPRKGTLDNGVYRNGTQNSASIDKLQSGTTQNGVYNGPPGSSNRLRNRVHGSTVINWMHSSTLGSQVDSYTLQHGQHNGGLQTGSSY